MEVSGLERSCRELGNVRKDRMIQGQVKLGTPGGAVLVYMFCEVRVPHVCRL